MGDIEIIIDVEGENYLAFHDFIGRALTDEQLRQVRQMLIKYDKIKFTFSPQGKPAIR
jgi:hypothetical protein